MQTILHQLSPDTPFFVFVTQLIGWLSGPGFAVFISMVLDRLPSWNTQSSEFKFFVSSILTAVGGYIGYLIGSNPDIAALPANNPSLAFGVVLVVFAIVQVWHKYFKANPDPTVTVTQTWTGTNSALAGSDPALEPETYTGHENP